MSARILKRAFGLCALLSALVIPRAALAQADFLFDLGAKGVQQQAFRVQATLLYPKQAPGHPTVARISFSCDPEHYVWADSIQVDLADAGGAGEGVSVDRLALPQPKEKYDRFLEDTVRYFDGEFDVSLLLNISSDVEPAEYELMLRVRYNGCGPDLCQPREDTHTVRLTVLQDAEPVAVELPEVSAAPPAGSPRSVEPAGGVSGSQALADRLAGVGPVLGIMLAFVLGLGLSLTPCVYPLIPVTVSLVGATAGGSKMDALVRSLIYVFGISVTYSAAGTAAALAGGHFGAWLQHPAIYLVLAVVFVLLAGGMLDLYSIDLSSQRLQRLQARLHGRAGLVGIWAMGLLSGAAATACIAPVIVGVLLYVGQRGSVLLGLLMFFALAWGMGTPLVVLGTFAGVLKAMPRSGMWMVRVKHVFGLALMSVAVYLVGKSRLVPEAWFRMLVGAVLLGGGVFVGAFDALSSDSGWWPRLRKTAGLLLMAGAVAAFLSVRGAPLAGAAAPAGAGTAEAIEWLDSEQKALELAKAEGKPVLLDFWADWCAPCHRMFSTSFADPLVVAESRRFATAKIDVEKLPRAQSDRFRREYGVWGVPTVVLISSSGERRSLAGYAGPDRLLEFMKSVR